MQLSVAFSRFLGKVSVTLDPYSSACLKPSTKPYEFPRDTHEADINQIATARTNVRHEREKNVHVWRAKLCPYHKDRRQEGNEFGFMGDTVRHFTRFSSQANWT